MFNLETVYLDDDDNALVILDQTSLPGEVSYLRLKTQAEIWEAIHELRVRGAPAIGIAAGYGLYLGVKTLNIENYDDLAVEFGRMKQYLASARPTAVNLFWALEKLETRLKSCRHCSIPEIKEALLQEAHAIKAEDVHTNRMIGEFGLQLLQPGMGILTHCNAGSLATGKYGTATAPIYLGQERGFDFKVFVDETRPLLQGARLTSFELSRAGVDVTLICDNMAATVMRSGQVQVVFVGCDRVAANGDTANKIGTLGVAILAAHYQIPFYVCAPTSSIDLDTPDGDSIPIEQRDPAEISEKWYAARMAPASGVKFYNPAFDVTNASLITAIITEYGVARPPFDLALREILAKKV